MSALQNYYQTIRILMTIKYKIKKPTFLYTTPMYGQVQSVFAYISKNLFSETKGEKKKLFEKPHFVVVI